jgi:hypothetical protein
MGISIRPECILVPISRRRPRGEYRVRDNTMTNLHDPADRKLTCHIDGQSYRAPMRK